MPTTATGDSIASAFLKTLSAPDTPTMRLAVVAWIRKESGGTIRANNPWNIGAGLGREIAKRGGPKPIGTRTITLKDGSKRYFAVYATVQDGARAAALGLLGAGSDWRKYDGVVAGARSGKPEQFFAALARSAWSEDRYGGVTRTLNASIPGTLANIYKSLGGNTSSFNLVPPDASGGTGGGTSTEILGAWNNAVQFPVGHVLTAADVETIIARLDSAKWFGDGPAAVIARDATRKILERYIGRAWNKQLQDEIAASAFAEADAQNALGRGIGDIAGALGALVGALFDPRKWLLFFALIAGAVMTAWGGINVIRAAA